MTDGSFNVVNYCICNSYLADDFKGHAYVPYFAELEFDEEHHGFKNKVILVPKITIYPYLDDVRIVKPKGNIITARHDHYLTACLISSFCRALQEINYFKAFGNRVLFNVDYPMGYNFIDKMLIMYETKKQRNFKKVPEIWYTFGHMVGYHAYIDNDPWALKLQKRKIDDELGWQYMQPSYFINKINLKEIIQ